MNRAQAAALISLITAFAKGEDVQYKSGATWYDTDNPNFSSAYEYRIKPKAEEFFAVYAKDGKRLAICTTFSDADLVRMKNPGSIVKTYVEASGK
jgi:hypothetical protein